MTRAMPRCLLDTRCELGEGVHWVERDRSVWFVDIVGQRLHRFDVTRGHHDSWVTPSRPGFVVSRGNGGVIVGLAKGLYSFSLESPTFELLTAVELDRPDNRLNDGVVGPDGALWFGSKNEPETSASGAWYRWTGRGEPERFDDGYVVTNGPAFSLDGRTLYHSDSVNRRVLRRSVGPDGRVGDNDVFAEIGPSAGYPDGLAVDAEDCLWVALYAGGALRRYAPDGALRDVVAIPAAHVTRPCFGGVDRRTLFVTTARAGLTPEECGERPLSGGLFALDVAVPGVAPFVLAEPA